MSFQLKFTAVIPPRDIACDPGCLAKLANNDREAYSWVYKNYCKKVYDYAMLITRNETMSEDIVQEVFLKLWHHREKLKTVENFNNYLYILYKNYILDVMKGQQKEIDVRHGYYHDKATHVTADEIISYRSKEQEVTKAVKQLPQQQQLVYRLSRECGWKREQIAKELKITPNTVKAHIQKALSFLRKKVAE